LARLGAKREKGPKGLRAKREKEPKEEK